MGASVGMAKKRQCDAELCRLKGWTPGDVLESEREFLPGHTYTQHYLLTAIGCTSVLLRRVHAETDTEGQPSGFMVVSFTEEKHCYSLRSHVIRKVGRFEEWLSSSRPVQREAVLTDGSDQERCQ